MNRNEVKRDNSCTCGSLFSFRNGTILFSRDKYICVGKHGPGKIVAPNMIHFCDATTFTTAAFCAVV